MTQVSGDDSDPALAQVRAIAEGAIAQRAQGADVSDEQLLRDHPDLAPLLKVELEKLRRVRLARLAAKAQGRGSASGPPTSALAAASDSANPMPSLGPPISWSSDGSAAFPVSEAPEIPGFRITALLGEGGMGRVWRADELSTRRQVAIKVVGALTPQHEERFRREIELAARLVHPGVVRIYQAGVAQGLLFYVMELVDGDHLDLFVRERRLGQAESLRLMVHVCEAVGFAHGRGVIHRDLKPSNILVSADGQPRLLDFGLARDAVVPLSGLDHRQTVTITGQFVGSLPWASPEQAQGRGDVIDTRTDVYSLGVILYQVLTGGKFPYVVTGGLHEVLHNILTVAPAPPVRALAAAQEREAGSSGVRASASPSRRWPEPIDPTVEAIVLRALAKRPEQRYATAAELEADLRRFLNHEATVARPPGFLARLRQGAMTRRVMMPVAVTVATIRSAASSVAAAIQQQPSPAARALQAARQLQLDAAVADAGRLMAEGDPLRALGPLATALAAANGDEARAAPQRVRMGAILRWSPKLALQIGQVSTEFWFSADGLKVLAHTTRHILVCDAATGQPLCTPIGLPEGAIYCRISPDGNLVAACSMISHTATLYDARTGGRLHVLKHDGPVPFARFSADGRRLVTACHDKFVRVWDCQTGQQVVPPMIHPEAVNLCAFSPDDRMIVTVAQSEGAARVWDAQTGQPLAPPMAAPGLHTAMFNPSSTRVATGSAADAAQVWDAQTGSPVGAPLRHSAPARVYASFSSDGTRVVTAGGDGTARVWDAETGQPVSPPLDHGAFVEWASFSPDGHRVVTGANDRNARVWDALTGAPLGPPLPHLSRVYRVAFSPDGRRVFSMDDGLLRAWKLPPPPASPLHPLAPWPAGVPTRAPARVLSPDGRFLFVMDSTRSFQLWDNQTCQPIGPLQATPVDLWYSGFSQDSRRLAVTVCEWNKTGPAGRPGFVTIYDTTGGAPVGPPIQAESGICCAHFVPGPNLVLVGEGAGVFRVWDYVTGHPVGPAIREPSVGIAFVTPNGRRLVVSRLDNSIRVWDADSGQTLTPPLAHIDRRRTWPYLVKFDRQGRRAVSYSGDRSLGIWDLEAGEAVVPPFAIATANSMGLGDLTMTPDGRYVGAATMSSRSIQVWDADTGSSMGPAARAKADVRAIGVSSDGAMVAAGCDDGTAQVWETRTGVPLTPPLLHANPVWSVRFSADQQQLVTSSWGHPAQVWDLSPDTRPAEELVLLGRLISGIDDGRPLTAQEADEAWTKLQGHPDTGQGGSA